MVTYVLFSLMVVQPLHANNNIGDITELRGAGQVVRDEPFPATLDFDINSYDDVRTANGRLGITFLDESQVRLTEHSQLIIDEFVYDANPSNSKMALSFASGTLRFISGELGRIDKENIQIETPTSQIGIRGTDFTVTVDELGRALIILLPNDLGDPSGEIVVATAAGTVVLNKPFQSTVTSMWESTPTKPMVLDISLELIDNLLIVSPPKEVDGSETTRVDGADDSPSDFLDIDYLDFNDLEIDLLAEDEDFTFTELDVDYLDVNFFEDLLAVIDEVSELDQEQLTTDFSGVNLVGTKLGQDLETNIITLIDGSEISFTRQVNNYLRLELDSGTSYNILIDDEGKTFNIIVGSGGSSTIRIKQSSG